jgi:hypothetical protein
VCVVVEIAGKQDPYAVFSFPWIEDDDEKEKSVQTSVHNDAGDSSEWADISLVSTSPFRLTETEGYDHTVKLKVMESNEHSKDKLIGKATIAFPPAPPGTSSLPVPMPGEWVQVSGELRDNHAELTGKFTVKLRLVAVPPPPEASPVTLATDAIVFRVGGSASGPSEASVKAAAQSAHLGMDRRCVPGGGEQAGAFWMMVAATPPRPDNEGELEALLESLVTGAADAHKTVKRSNLEQRQNQKLGGESSDVSAQTMAAMAIPTSRSVVV